MDASWDSMARKILLADMEEGGRSCFVVVLAVGGRRQVVGEGGKRKVAVEISRVKNQGFA